MPKRPAPARVARAPPKPAVSAATKKRSAPPAGRKRRTLLQEKEDVDAPALLGTATSDAAAVPPATRKKRAPLFPSDPTVVRRALAFDVGIVNLAHAVVTLTGVDDLAIESLGANNIMQDDPADGPLTDEQIIAAAASAGPRRRRRPGEAPPAAPPKAKGRGAKEPLKVLTERITAYLWARADRLLGRRPHAVVIEQQSKKALRLSALGAVIHSFVLNYYRARGEEPPPVFMQSGRQKLRVVFRPLPLAAGSNDWRLGDTASGRAPSLMTRFLVAKTSSSSSSSTTTTRSKQGTGSSAAAPNQAPGDGGRPAATRHRKGKAEEQGNNATPKAAAKGKSKKKQKRAEQGVVWRANKKHAVDNFAPILAHYPGCRRWKPLFDQSKKKDDLADAALHAIFMLKAGGTSLARTKDLDEASLIILPHRSDSESDPEQGLAVSKTRAPRRRRIALDEPREIPDAKYERDDVDDGIIDLVHYATDPVSDTTSARGEPCGSMRRVATLVNDDGSVWDERRYGVADEGDVVGDERTICLAGAEPPLKRPRHNASSSSSPLSLSTRTTSTRRSTHDAHKNSIAYDDDDDDTEEDSEDEDEDDVDDSVEDDDGDSDATGDDTSEQDDDDWALDLGIC